MNKRRGNNKKKRDIFSNQMSLFDDEFFDNKMMRGFGSDFFNNFGGGKMNGFENQFSTNFDNMKMNMMNMDMDMNFGDMEIGGFGNGNMVSHSVSTKTTIGPDGKPITVKKVKNKTSAMGRNGERIEHTSEVLKDGRKGIKRVIKERKLGNKKMRVVREKKNGQKNIYRNIENIEDHELADFNKEWDHKAKVNNLPQINIDEKKKRKKKTNKVKALKYYL